MHGVPQLSKTKPGIRELELWRLQLILLAGLHRNPDGRVYQILIYRAPFNDWLLMGPFMLDVAAAAGREF